MPNKFKLQHKKNICKALNKFNASIILSYKSTSVNDFEKMRNTIRSTDTCVSVVKNKVFSIAAKELNYEGRFIDIMKGQNVVIYAEDIISVAKNLVTFIKEYPSFIIKGAIIDNQLQDSVKVYEYAELPTLKESRAKILSLLSSSGSKICTIIAQPAMNIIRLLKNRNN